MIIFCKRNNPCRSKLTRALLSTVVALAAAASFPARAEGGVKATITGKRSIATGFAGYNTPITLSRLPWSAEVGSAAAAFYPGMLRYPGGTIDDYWDWRKGGVSPANPGQFANYEVGPDTPAVFLCDFLRNGVEKTQAEPIYVLNMLNGTIENQIAMLKRARELGYPVHYAELGNEYYYQTFAKQFPSAEAYASFAELWAEKIKRAITGIKLGVVTSQNDRGGAPVRDSKQPLGWNEVVAANVPAADALIQHIYPPLTGIGHHQLSSSNINTFLADPIVWIDTIMGEIVPLASTNSKEIWVTEFNAYDWGANQGKPNGCPQERQSWAHGLFVAEMAAHLSTYPVTHMLLHQLTDPNNYTSMLRLAQSGSLSGAQATADGLTMQWFAWAAKNATTVSSIQFSPNAYLSAGETHSMFALVGTLFSAPDCNRAFIMNLGASTANLETRSLFKTGCNYQQRYVQNGNFARAVTGAGSIVQTAGQTSRQLMLPPYSVTILSGN